MATKTAKSKLRIVDDRDKTDAVLEKLEQEWTEAVRSWKLAPAEIKARVHLLRARLESYRDQFEAVPFDIAVDGIPNCLDQKRERTENLINDLDPRVNGIEKELLKRIARVPGATSDDESVTRCSDLQNNLWRIKFCAEEISLRVGMLAGVIFAGCPKETVDRFERGLAFSLIRDPVPVA